MGRKFKFVRKGRFPIKRLKAALAAPAQGPRKRGRPRKQQKSPIIEMSSNSEYTQEQ